MEDTWEIQKADETRLFQNTVPSKKQRRYDNFCNKTVVWATDYIKVDKNTE